MELSGKDLKKLWAMGVIALLLAIAVATVDVALMLSEGISVEYVEEVEE